MGYIYKITNLINNKVYIGKTERNPQVRWEEHKRHFIPYMPISVALNKYGVENFNFEIIEETDNVNEREKYWIEYYESCILNGKEKGYNLTYGGEGNIKFSIENMIFLYEQGKTCREIAEIIGCNPTTVGIRLKQVGYTIEDTSKNSVIKAKQREYDPVLQFDLNGNFIKEWDNASIIEKETGMRRSNIKAVCNGKGKTAYGYVWKRKNKTGPQRP